MPIRETTNLVAIIDDDDLMRSSLEGLLKAAGLSAQNVCVGGGLPELRPATP